MTTEEAFQTILKELGRALAALQPYRNDILVVGGVVPVVYRHMPGLKPPGHPPLMTTEADLTVPPKLPLKDKKSIADLLADAGFVLFEAPALDVRRRGAQRFQDASHGTAKPAPTYLELLAPMRGKPKEGVIEPQPGVRAQPLRYLDLLAHEPLEVSAKQVPELGIDDDVLVRVPHPAMYVLQKALARKSGRVLAKQPKDMAYVYDVAMLTQPVWPDLGAVVARAADESEEWAAWIRKALALLDELFASETADGVIEAAQVYRDAMRSGAPTERAIATVVQRFLAALRAGVG